MSFKIIIKSKFREKQLHDIFISNSLKLSNKIQRLLKAKTGRNNFMSLCYKIKNFLGNAETPCLLDKRRITLLKQFKNSIAGFKMYIITV